MVESTTRSWQTSVSQRFRCHIRVIKRINNSDENNFTLINESSPEPETSLLLLHIFINPKIKRVNRISKKIVLRSSILVISQFREEMILSFKNTERVDPCNERSPAKGITVVKAAKVRLVSSFDDSIIMALLAELRVLMSSSLCLHKLNRRYDDLVKQPHELNEYRVTSSAPEQHNIFPRIKSVNPISDKVSPVSTFMRHPVANWFGERCEHPVLKGLALTWLLLTELTASTILNCKGTLLLSTRRFFKHPYRGIKLAKL
jgi:hypothetical protein